MKAAPRPRTGVAEGGQCSLEAQNRVRKRWAGTRAEKERFVNRKSCTVSGKAISAFSDTWRRRRDSNPRYALRAYNGLANRRLQPLGHVSVEARMPETGRTGKRMYGKLCREGILNGLRGAQRRKHWATRQHRLGWQHKHPTHGELPTTYVPEHCEASARGGVNPSTVIPLTTGCEIHILHTGTHPIDVGGPEASGLSLADALSRRPRRRFR